MGDVACVCNLCGKMIGYYVPSPWVRLPQHSFECPACHRPAVALPEETP